MRLVAEGNSRIRAWARITLGLGLGALIALPAACSDTDKALPGGTETGGVGNSPAVGPCTAGTSQKCGVTLGDHNGVLTCYMGTQYCENEVWGECTGGEVVNKPSQSSAHAPGSNTQAISPPTVCNNNPCDPYCQTYNEVPPDGGQTADAGQAYTWPVGGLGDLPGGLVNKGLKEPCASGADCQFNHYCKEPKTGTNCGHSKCQTGGGLAANCDPCVGMICAANPSCCTPTFNSSCAHSPCSTGGRLKANCDPCAAAVCALPGRAYCCQGGNSWNAACVASVPAACGVSCNSTWSQACVNQVQSVCDAKCGSGAPPPESGQCEPWLPGQTDPACSGIDLAGGIPCDQKIPVCNHGNTTAPSGIRIIHFPANSNQYPKTAPSQTHPQMQQCVTNAPIPPGQCRSFDCPNLGNGNREIMINPPQGSSGIPQVAECSTLDNWTLFSGGTACGPPSCAGGSEVVQFKPVNMYVQFDKSGSMGFSGGTKWTGSTNAMKAFFQSNASAGMGVALEFFPLPAGGAGGDGCGYWNCAGGTCAAAPCSNPMVPLGTLAVGVDAQETALVNAINSQAPGGGTPTYPALDGALDWATTQQAGDPNSIYVVVLITDGDPTQCDTSSNNIAALSQSAFNNDGVRTYAIGMEGANIGALNQIAAAGGTTQAIVIQGTNQNNIQAQLLAAFQAIAAQNINCTFPLPAAGTFDPNDVNLTSTSSSNVQTSIGKVLNAAACGPGGGWYFDNNGNPSTITLCPASCNAVQGDPGASVELKVGCPKVFLPTNVRQTYEAQCPPGTKPQWGFMAYDTTTPGTSTVQFRARTATTQTGLGSATFTNLKTAQATPNTQVCAMSGPVPCPIDLYTTLGTPNARYPWLQLEAVLTPNPASVTPTLNDWQITYSCPPGE